MPGELTITPTVADVSAANRTNLILAWSRRRTWRAWLGIVALLAGGGAVLGYCIDSDEAVIPTMLGYALLAAILMPLVHAITYMLVPRRVRRLFTQQSSAGLSQHWRWSGHGMEVENAQGSARQAWQDLFGWRATSDMLLLYLNERTFYALPRHAASEAAWVDLIASVRQSGLRRY